MASIKQNSSILKATRVVAVFLCLALSILTAQELPKDKLEGENPIEEEANGGLTGSFKVRRDARTMTLAIPAPRGQITDRNGKPFAQNIVVWYPALKFPHFEKADREFVVEWGRKRIEQANQLFSIDWKVTDQQLWDHYRHRRWMAMPVTHVVDGARKIQLEGKMMSGLILHPVYKRHYPQGECAAHIIGYVGSVGNLEKGPINYGDPIFERMEGRSGLEKEFDEVLTGREGLRREDYESDGRLVLRKYTERPRPGGTIVTTLDMEWQKKAEEILSKRAERGAFVVVDIQTGDVMAMASRPSFNLNDFVPFISTDTYTKLREDPGTPLFARAFQGTYPPASTFKPIVAVTALSNGVVDEYTLIDCPAKIQIGKHWFHNWSTTPEGFIDVKRAIARSTNPWFYKVGIKTGPTAFLSVARKLGLGEKTGLPLTGEAAGLIPTNDWMKKYHKRRMMDGDTANLSIGQGVMLATPLQVAQAMAGLGNGHSLPKLSLVKQVQDVRGRLLMTNAPEIRNNLQLSPKAVSITQEGMMQVVHAGYGTGQRAKLSYTIMCGKTGTAQWGPPSKNQRLAWFAGFFPLENPRYAFAALYEGKPGEKVSGGRLAAPIVSDFFEHFKDEIEHRISPAPVALVVEDEESLQVNETDVVEAPRAVLIEDEDGAEILPDGEGEEQPRAILVDEDGEDVPNVVPELPPLAIPVDEDEEDEEENQPEAAPEDAADEAESDEPEAPTAIPVDED